QATDLVWLGLEASGQSSRLGVTAEHPLYVEGRGWVQAGELAVGDRIVNADGGVITVVSRELGDRPTLVHNLEVAGAHTYFAGELEAWGHNGRKFRGSKRADVMCKNGGKCVRCGKPATHADHIWPWSRGGQTEIWNGQPLCAACNFQKSCSLPIEGVDLDWRPPMK
uniref:polymorphic toxin-type HINT domain-containing protein n=1 Tax=Frigidibacter sp. SD6-1 TaxID=3032581 RepID=UPI0024DF62BF